MRKRFMVAVDGSTSSLQALMHAAELAKEGDEITIVTVSSKARPAPLHVAAAHAAPQSAPDIKTVYLSAEGLLAQAERVLQENYRDRLPKYRTYIRASGNVEKELVDFARRERTQRPLRCVSALRRYLH